MLRMELQNGEMLKKEVQNGKMLRMELQNGEMLKKEVQNGKMLRMELQNGEMLKMELQNGEMLRMELQNREMLRMELQNMNGESRDVEDGATESRDVEDGATEWSDVEDGATEWRDVEDRATIWRYVEDGTTEWRDDEDGISEWSDVENKATERRDVEDGATIWRDAKDGTTECRDDEDGTTEWRNVEVGTTDWRDVKDGATEWRDVHDGATEQRNVENGAAEQKNVKNGATERTDVTEDWKEVKDGATEWKEFKDESVEELKVVGDENKKLEKFKGDGTKCQDVADEEAVFEEAVKDPVHKIGHLICKRVTDKNGTKTRRGQRAWKPFKAVLQGMILYLQKDTHDLSKTENGIRVHHALAYSIDHKKRPHVLCLKTADLRLFYFQAESEEEQASWIATLNSIAGFTCPEGNATESKNKAVKETEWKVVGEVEEAMGMEPIHKIGFVICKRVTDKNETKTWKHQRSWKPFSAVLQGMILYLKTDTPDLSKTAHGIRVHHALAYPIDYKKRQHVLCLRTADRRHFFFQAESEEEQASWIATINCIAACYSAPPHIPVSHDKMSHCPQFLPSFSTHLSLEQQLECYTYQFLKVSKHLSYYNSLPFKEGTLSVGYMLQEVKRYETYVRELQKLVAAKDAGEGCSDLEIGTLNFYKQDKSRFNFIDSQTKDLA
ncbi:PH and SEC7 domain-containing protein 2 [Bagarius yarrelli]|uniref:PH and SEC7 domain-containing protein 2 n=1 Tax=Bagarius yarrelli TaxID=175774 RepID=A0A556V9K7_BAGYA|nr:PH and SEC7 domain-containing protein 2 [Bagarius yarrelli]